MSSLSPEAGPPAADPSALPEAYPDRPHLRDSRQLNWSRSTSSPQALQVIEQLVAEVDRQAVRQRARKEDDRRRLQATLRAMVLDLFHAAEQPRRPWVAYARRPADYACALTRYLSPDVTYTAAMETAEFLVRNGYADHRKGSFVRTDYGGGIVLARGYRSRLRALPRLVKLFQARGVSQGDLEDGETQETIRLKGPAEGKYRRKPLLPYEDTERTRKMRRQLADWAAVVNGFRITVEDGGRDGDLDPDDEEEAGEYADPRTAVLYRVFNDGRWSRGGRFYGGWWQSLPKAVRSTIRIDGEATVELDFRSMHPRILYQLTGSPISATVDPYAMGKPWGEDYRDLAKVAFNQLLAISGNGMPRKPPNSQLPEGTTYGALITAIEARHAPLASWFRHGRASELQNIDANIAEGVLRYMPCRRRPVLPVHDSFIVAQRDERMLGETMCLSYRTVMKELSGARDWPVIANWTSTEVEQAVYASLEAAREVT